MRVGSLESYIISRKQRVPLEKILPDPNNVRDKYSRESLIVLADSIARNGQLQPALIERSGRKYSIVAGHRRYWASMLAVESGWMDRKYMLGKVVRKLPPNLRLRLQCAENEFKAPVPKDNLANVLWERYKLTLIDEIGNISEDQKEMIHEASDFNKIPEELRSNFPVSIYAKNMGIGETTVRNAFSYQMLNNDIKARVANPEDSLTYSAACILSRIENKNEQRRILKLVEDQNEVATRFHVKTAVDQYIQSIEQEAASGRFMVMEGPSKARVGTLRDLSIYLGKAERLVRVLRSVKAFVKNIDNLEIRVNTHTTTPKKIVDIVYKPLRRIHEGFLTDVHYKNIWEFVPKRLSLMDFVKANHGKTLAAGECVMDLVESKVISISEIKANPLNPRGKKKDFDKKDLRRLAKSIERDGLVHDILVMKKGNDYINLEGHRRHAAMQLLAKKNLKMGVLVIPELTEDQQVKLMCDADLFEQMSLDARARVISRQYALEKEKRHGKFKVEEFVKMHPEWSSKVIRNCIAYDSLPEEVKKLQAQGLITYGATIEISKIKNPKAQRDFAISSAILEQSKYALRKAVEFQSEVMLFDKNGLEEMRRQAELKTLASELESNLEGVRVRMQQIAEGRLVKKFKGDDYLVHKFQRLMRALQDAA